MVPLTWSNYDQKLEQLQYIYKPQKFNMDTQNLLKEVPFMQMIMLC